MLYPIIIHIFIGCLCQLQNIFRLPSFVLLVKGVTQRIWGVDEQATQQLTVANRIFKLLLGSGWKILTVFIKFFVIKLLY